MNLSWLDKNDVNKITQLFCDGFADGWSQKMLCDAFETNRFLALGIEAEQKLVGVITSSTTLFDADIETVFVKKEYRKQGLATMLIQGLEKALLEKNIEKIFLEVRLSNLPAQNLYLKNGFKKINVRKNYYSDLEDAVVMAKELTK